MIPLLKHYCAVQHCVAFFVNNSYDFYNTYNTLEARWTTMETKLVLQTEHGRFSVAVNAGREFETEIFEVIDRYAHRIQG